MSTVIESVTHSLAGASITVNTEDLFRAWLAQQLATSSFFPVEAERQIATFSAPLLREGEHWAGPVFDENGKPMHNLILLPDELESATWKDAQDFAAAAGGVLPTRQEQALLYANLKAKFKPVWHWSSEQYSDVTSYAWMQHFGHGIQYSSTSRMSTPRGPSADHPFSF